MKAIFIDSTARTVTEVETDLTDGSLTAILGGTGLFKGALGIWGGTMALSERAASKDAPYFTIEGGISPIVGNAVIFGSNRTIDQIRAGVKFLTHAEGLDQRQKESEAIQKLMTNIALGIGGMLGGSSSASKKHHERVTVPAKELPADIKPGIVGEARAMLDILSDKLEGRK